jgi:glutamate decarboxylase
MPAKVAYQMVHDEMSLDGNPSQNMATFVSTWMEPEADKLILESHTKNFVDYDEYPQTQQIHQRCVSMLANLFHADGSGNQARGTSCVGSSEAFMLAGLALKFRWRAARKAKGLPYDKPNIVFGTNAQVCLEKFALYFDVEMRQVPVTVESNYVLPVKEALKLIDENTIVVVAILGSTFTGHFEPVKELNDELIKLNEKTGWDVGIHVDGASGAFVAPFLYPDLEWDFRLPLVRSINVSGHKFGLVYAGVGWVIWRSKEYLPEELIFNIDYLGGQFPTFTLNFSRNASPVVSQYYNFLRLGKKGYQNVIQNCANNAYFLSRCLEKSGYFNIISDVKKGLPLIAFSLKRENDDFPFSEYDLMHQVRQRGWILPAYKLPKNIESIHILRVVVREIHSEDMIEVLVADILWAYETLRNRGTQAKEALTGDVTDGVRNLKIESVKNMTSDTETFSRTC